MFKTTPHPTGTGVKKTTKTFGYDACFSQFAKQEDVFKATVSPMVEEVLNGFSCTCFAYGQTGACLFVERG